MIEFGPDVLHDYAQASSREWLETNGIGGFASSTLAGSHSRRYHGLLTAATDPPSGRLVLLSKLEEALVLDGQTYELSANRYVGAIHPQGFQHLKSFRSEPFPTFVYQVNGVELTRTIFMVHGENTVVIEYRLEGAPEAELVVRPLVAFRDYHALTHENAGLDPTVDRADGQISIRPYPALPRLYFSVASGRPDVTACWYRNFEYDVERERGLDHIEDLYSPFGLRLSLSEKAMAGIVASTEPGRTYSGALRRKEQMRREAPGPSLPVDDSLVDALSLAAESYVADRGAGKTLIAGYHWFTDWGRDTMIALPGLALVRGRHTAARGILEEFSRHVSQGMLPNRFPDSGNEPEYNTIDATFWYFEAVRSYLAYTGDVEFARFIFPVLEEIIEWHVNGTRFGIRADDDGLITCDDSGAQLTWMDARIGDWVVTPRQGKAVEIQALWYNALCLTAQMATPLGRHGMARDLKRRARQVRERFNVLFWNSGFGCLYDRIAPTGPDATLRPNQILAASLHHSMLSRDKAAKVVGVVGSRLLTPYGLRSLDPGDPGYRGRYEGDPGQRDSAYHQGPVWAWLLGPFITAYVRVHGRTPETVRRTRGFLGAFEDHLREACVGQVSEIFDGDAPHTPRGCVAQAWSVAELLRALVEDVHGLRPAPGLAASHAGEAVAAGRSRPKRSVGAGR